MTSQAVQAEIIGEKRVAGRLNFYWLWAGSAFGDLADGLFKVALPLLVASLTSSPLLVAGVVFVLRLPWLIFGLLAGVLVDRLDRQKLIAAANSLRVASLLALSLLLIFNMLSLAAIYVLALILGVAETLADTAATSLLPLVMPASGLEKANARLVGAQTVMNEFIGPVLGGALMALGFVFTLATSSSLYLVALVAILLLRGKFQVRRETKTGLKADLKEGLIYLWHHKLIRTLTIMVGVMNLCWSAWSSVLVLYVVTPGPGGLNPFGYGLLLTVIGIGGLAGSFLVMPVQRKFGSRWAIGADIIGTFTMGAVPLLTASPWWIGAAALVGGAGATMWSVTVASLRQRIVPDHLMGRVASASRLVGFGALSIGSLMAGIVAQLVGVQVVFGLTALLTALLVWPFFRDITDLALKQARNE